MRNQIIDALLLIPFAALALRAQPVRSPAAPLPLMQSMSIDIGAAMQDRVRIALEPITLGRVSVAIGAATSTHSARGPYVVLPPHTTSSSSMVAPCAFPGCTQSTPRPQFRHRASSVGLRLRWYPDALARDGARNGIAGYVGESVEWEERSATTYTYYPQPIGTGPVPAAGIMDWPYGETVSHRIRGWEPSLEFGTRLTMAGRVMIDLGATTKLVRLDDPDSRLRPGQTESRLTFALGFGW